MANNVNNINHIQVPNSSLSGAFDMAYGPNAITLEGLTTGDKYALRIFVVGNPVPIADIRQTPNRQGRAIFDIQNILQAYVGPQVNTIDSLHFSLTGFVAQNERLALAGPTLVQYQIAYAEESGGVVGAFYTIPDNFTSIAGSVSNTFKYHLTQILIDLK